MRGHWRRLFFQLAFLGLGGVIEAISQDAFITLTALLLIGLPTACWTVFALLLWTSSQAPDIQSLHEKVDDALTLALASTVAAMIGLLTLARLFSIIDFPIGPFITVGLGFVAVAISIPAIGFLRTWRDIYLPMVRRRRSAAAEVVSEAAHASGLAAMESRLQASIDENTHVSQEASDNAKKAFHEANDINNRMLAQDEQINEQGKQIMEQQAAAGRRHPEEGASGS